jgi:P4 family phage/plasmid primase-like protien
MFNEETLDTTPENPNQGFNYDKAKKNPTILSIQFIKEQPEIIIYNNDIYFWNGKYFDCPKEAKIHQMIFKFYEDNNILHAWRPQDSKNLLEALKMNSHIKQVDEIDDSDNLLNLNNGVFSLDELKLYPHDPKYNFSYKIEVDYNPYVEAKDHPHFTEFLNSLFTNDDGSFDEEATRLVLFIFAYMLYPQIKIETIFLFLGDGANGKSVLIQIMKNFFPKKYVTGMSLNAMSDEQGFNRTGLIHSRLNIATEQKGGSGNKVDSEEIKKIASGEEITIYKKFHVDPIEIISKTKILAASNDLPYFNDTTHGIVRRLTMLDFKNKFVFPDEYVEIDNPKGRKIYLMKDKDTLLKNVKEEKSAIFNTLLLYLQELKKRGWRLPKTANSTALKDEYVGVSDVFGTWLEETYVFDGLLKEHEQISSLEILRDFLAYYEENFPGKKSSHTTHIVGKKVKQIFRDDGERIRKETIKTNGSKEVTRVKVYKLRRKNIIKQHEQRTLPDIWGNPIES